jgi:hypothetical protein
MRVTKDMLIQYLTQVRSADKDPHITSFFPFFNDSNSARSDLDLGAVNVAIVLPNDGEPTLHFSLNNGSEVNIPGVGESGAVHPQNILNLLEILIKVSNSPVNNESTSIGFK